MTKKERRVEREGGEENKLVIVLSLLSFKRRDRESRDARKASSGIKVERRRLKKFLRSI